MSGEVRRWMPLDNGYGIEDAAGPYVLHSDYADLLARYEAVVSWPDRLKVRNWTQEMHAAWHTNIPDTVAAFDALIRAMQDNGGG